MNKAVLQIQELTKTFSMGESCLQVLKGINLTISAGEIVAIVGPSGAGKSTLLNIAGGLMRPSSGSVLLLEQAVFSCGEEGLSRIRNQLVGFIFQMHHLLPEFSAMENVAMPGLIAGQSRLSANQRARELLRQVGLEERWKHRPGELSGGEQQRVAIARALFNQPGLLLADEPTGDLDGTTAREIFQLLMKFNKERGQTLVMVSHNPELASLADRVITLQDGKIV